MKTLTFYQGIVQVSGILVLHVLWQFNVTPCIKLLLYWYQNISYWYQTHALRTKNVMLRHSLHGHVTGSFQGWRGQPGWESHSAVHGPEPSVPHQCGVYDYWSFWLLIIIDQIIKIRGREGGFDYMYPYIHISQCLFKNKCNSFEFVTQLKIYFYS